MKHSLQIVMAACVLLAACDTMTPAQKAALTAQASRPVVCVSALDCRVKWSRAVQWVSDYSAYKFKTQTDLVIETMGPAHDDPRPAFTITRTANADGTSTINFDGDCANIFGCIPSMLEERASFVQFVMGP